MSRQRGLLARKADARVRVTLKFQFMPFPEMPCHSKKELTPPFVSRFQNNSAVFRQSRAAGADDKNVVLECLVIRHGNFEVRTTERPSFAYRNDSECRL